MAKWAWRDVSLGFAAQSALTTENTTSGDFEYIPVEVSIPDLVRDAEDFDFTTAQVDAREAPAVGGKHGSTFGLRLPLRGMKSGYDPTAEQPGVTADVISRELALLGMILGSNNSAATTNANFFRGAHLKASAAYASGDVASATSTAVTVQAGSGANYAAGDLAVFDDSASQTSPQIGFIKSIAADVLTLFEASQNTSASGEENYGTVTGYISNAAPVPLTFRVLGDQTEFGQVFVGCVATNFTLSLTPNQSLIAELTMQCTSRRWDNTLGGLQVKDAFTRLPPMIGSNGGYTTVDGTAACGLTDITLSCDIELKWFDCASGLEGYNEVKVVRRNWSLSFAIPHDSSDTITGGEHQYEYAFEQRSTTSFGFYLGNTVGQIMAWLMPAWIVMEQPKLENIDGVLYHRVTYMPGEYGGDGASTNAGNSILRFGAA